MVTLPEWFSISHRTTPSVENNERCRSLLNAPYWDQYAASLLQLLPGVSSFGEIGCAQGMLVGAMSRLLPHARGFEPLLSDVTWGQAHQLPVEQALGWDLPAEYQEFDLMYSHHVMEHIPFDYLGLTLSELDWVTGKYLCMGIPIHTPELLAKGEEPYADTSKEADIVRGETGHFILQPEIWWEDLFRHYLPRWERFMPVGIESSQFVSELPGAIYFFLRRLVS